MSHKQGSVSLFSLQKTYPIISVFLGSGITQTTMVQEGKSWIDSGASCVTNGRI